jgi:hypothetical protein
MTPFERAFDRYDANSRARKRARARRAQQTELKADIANVLADIEAVLVALPNQIATTPTGATTLKDVTGHVKRLLHHLSVTRS